LLTSVLLALCVSESAIIFCLERLLARSKPLERFWCERQLRLFRDKKVTPRRATRCEKIAFALLSRMLPNWRELSFAFTPRTVMRWRRDWVAILMRRSRHHCGRPRLSDEMRETIRRMARENRAWGPGRIMRELAKSGLIVSRNTVRHYLREIRRPSARGDQRWSTFIRNHAAATLAMDFAVDYFPTLTGQLRRVWILVLLEIGSRRLLRLEATEHPTRAWLAQQLRDAIPAEHSYRYLVHDNDPLWDGVDETIAHFAIHPLRIPPGSPQANSYAERLIGTLRRELLDWIWPLGVRHFNRLLVRYRAYYNRSRPHMGLDGRVPDPPRVERILASKPQCIPDRFTLTATPHLGGLHHDYRLEPLDRAA
jgi:putative transposase